MSSPGSGNVFKMTKVSKDVIVLIVPKLQREDKDQYLVLTAKSSRWGTPSNLSRQLWVKQFQGKRRDVWDILVYMLAGLSDVFCSPQLIVTSG
ncbi:hypothetical protein TNCV_1748691 [Trichonephila clavipes]|nr:hypothetical protein TNCV_1748691 [Trichonephila clavipes]